MAKRGRRQTARLRKLSTGHSGLPSGGPTLLGLVCGSGLAQGRSAIGQSVYHLGRKRYRTGTNDTQLKN